jgi:hypothetical protein
MLLTCYSLQCHSFRTRCCGIPYCTSDGCTLLERISPTKCPLAQVGQVTVLSVDSKSRHRIYKPWYGAGRPSRYDYFGKASLLPEAAFVRLESRDTLAKVPVRSSGGCVEDEKASKRSLRNAFASKVCVSGHLLHRGFAVCRARQRPVRGSSSPALTCTPML